MSFRPTPFVAALTLALTACGGDPRAAFVGSYPGSTATVTGMNTGGGAFGASGSGLWLVTEPSGSSALQLSGPVFAFDSSISTTCDLSATVSAADTLTLAQTQCTISESPCHVVMSFFAGTGELSAGGELALQGSGSSVQTAVGVGCSGDVTGTFDFSLAGKRAD